MIVNLEGLVATGKSGWLYTAPKPLVCFNFDLGADRAIFGTKFNDAFSNLKVKIVKYKPQAIEPYRMVGQGKDQTMQANPDFTKGLEVFKQDWQTNDIVVYELPVPVQFDPVRLQGVMKLWNTYRVLSAFAVQDAKVRTIGVDTGSLLRRVASDAYLEELQAKGHQRKQLLQIEWGHANDEVRMMYDMAPSFGKNLIVVHHLIPERKDFPQPDGTMKNMETGGLVIDGWRDSDRKWDIGIRFDKKAGKVVAKYTKCGYNLSFEGRDIPEGLLDWNGMVNEIDGAAGGRYTGNGMMERAPGNVSIYAG